MKYALSFSEPGRGGFLLADGPRPVTATRIRNDDGQIGFGCQARSPDPRLAIREAWFQVLLAGTDVPPLPPQATVDLKWSGGRQPWRRKTTQAIEDLHEHFRLRRDALHTRGFLTDEAQQTLQPRLVLVVRDERRLRRHPLPPLPEIPFAPRVPPPHPPLPRGGL